MIPYPKGKRSQLFSLRVWTEETAEGATEWRGKVERVTSGQVLYFRDWDLMLAFLRNEPYSSPEETQSDGGQQGTTSRGNDEHNTL